MEERYDSGQQVDESGRGIIKGLVNASASVFSNFLPTLPKVRDASRFHVLDDSGKVQRNWWQLSEPELEQHIKSLEATKVIAPRAGEFCPGVRDSGCGFITSDEMKTFKEDVKKYTQSRRLVGGGLANLGMITAYFAANSTLAGDKETRSLNVHELYSEIALLAMREPSAQKRELMIDQYAGRLVKMPEVRENKLFDKKPDQEIITGVKAGINSAIARFEQSPFGGIFRASVSQAAGLVAEAQSVVSRAVDGGVVQQAVKSGTNRLEDLTQQTLHFGVGAA